MRNRDDFKIIDSDIRLRIMLDKKKYLKQTSSSNMRRRAGEDTRNGIMLTKEKYTIYL